METKHVSSTLYRMRKLFVFIAALLTMLPGFAHAVLFDANVAAKISTNGVVGSWASQPNGPYILNLGGYTDRAAGVWTDYGLNRAGSSVALEKGKTASSAWVMAHSKWTDQLTVFTPDVALDAWVRLLFSIRLDGHLEAFEDNFTNSRAEVDYTMSLNHDGSWITRPSYERIIGPTPNSTAGGHVEYDVDEILIGEIAIRNGHTFNLISTLSANAEAELMGPPGKASAESLFSNSAEWLGGSVWIDGKRASSFTITSASGYDYGPRSSSVVPEPGTWLLMGSGVVGLIAARKKLARR